MRHTGTVGSQSFDQSQNRQRHETPLLDAGVPVHVVAARCGLALLLRTTAKRGRMANTSATTVIGALSRGALRSCKPFGSSWVHTVFQPACKLGFEGIVAKRRDRTSVRALARLDQDCAGRDQGDRGVIDCTARVMMARHGEVI